MLSLQVSDVAIAGEVQSRIRVRRATVKGKRAGYNRPLHPQAAAALQDYLDTLTNPSRDAFVFPGRRAATRLSKTAGWRAIKRVFREAGLKGAPREVGTHTLRKTFARLIYSAIGHDLVRTSYAMRHASVATTIKHLFFTEEEVDAVILNIQV